MRHIASTGMGHISVQPMSVALVIFAMQHDNKRTGWISADPGIAMANPDPNRNAASNRKEQHRVLDVFGKAQLSI